MSKIQVLCDILASQVAAGEVVERPASVVRELVDNAIDAGATKIEVVLHQGGQSLIRVVDNGCGMSIEDMHMSIQRHATSKISVAEDLHDIHTRGFRGEALPSILSVSRFKLASKLKAANELELGHELIIDGGKLIKESSIMMSSGTIIEIKDLFYNVPARRKFLKSQGAESAQVDKTLRQQALSAPHIHLTFKRDGKLIFDWPAVSDYQERIAQSIGASLAQSLISLEQVDADTGISLKASFLPPSFAAKTRKQQQFFVNQRPVENAMLSYVLRDALDSLEWRQQFPLAWIYLTIDPAQVDVNVHPAKKEIRFSNEPQVRSFVLKALSQVWRQWQLNQHATNTPSHDLESQGYVVMEGALSYTKPPYEHESSTQPIDTSETLSAELPPSVPPINLQALEKLNYGLQGELIQSVPVDKVSHFIPLALLANQYLLLQNNQSQALSIINTKFAQERLIYEQLSSQHEGGALAQKLLLPEIIELSAEEKNLWEEQQESFEQAGFEVQSFGAQTVQLCAVPHFVGVAHACELFKHMLASLSEWQAGRHTQDIPWKEFCLKVTKIATRGWKLEMSQSTEFLEKLLQTTQPYQSPSGKLIWKTFRPQDLERFF